MFSLFSSGGLHSALKQHTACISFTPEGIILEASEPFLNTVGYTLDQLKGQHHRIFCSAEEANSREYHAFWQALATGESQHGRYKRINSHGEEIWLEATYLPVKNRRGKILRVFKVANDVTQKHQSSARERAVLE